MTRSLTIALASGLRWPQERVIRIDTAGDCADLLLDSIHSNAFVYLDFEFLNIATDPTSRRQREPSNAGLRQKLNA